ncbi:MAG: hypothetical protein JWM85_1093 [Acidimicrobiaceae bacterium]|nr:hypothetical protein [Acidimicrobiaceae bacterium]
MRLLGLTTLIAALVGLAAAAVLGVQSIPDIKRYLKIRAM